MINSWKRKILLTSFQTWLPHQKSNSSDDLLAQIAGSNFPDAEIAFLRQLVVDTETASKNAIGKIQQWQPDLIVCCGMAESRTQLTIESNATCGAFLLQTKVDLSDLLTGLEFTEISHDAGKFVCEGLYYEVLNYLQQTNSASLCIFVHIPLLTPENSPLIITDFCTIINKLVRLVNTSITCKLKIPTSHYQTLGEVVKEFQIKYEEANFIVETQLKIPNHFREDLETVMKEGIVDNCESAICENLIYPILKEAWKSYRSKLLLWSHQPLNYESDLSYFPEYILAQRSSFGKIVFDQPYLLLVKAKPANFNTMLIESLVETIAAQQLNQAPNLKIFSIITNGFTWQFGQLKANTFTKNITFYTIQELERLFAAINYLFNQCDLQIS
ncbi:hypothetical protein [Oscillatoria salina]|uniref:hypothetical protein n=1 Tax=Oscillatoria salina TaxID=331517 RepID=UPI00296211DB|nr:hypothetical protein [Oscillatoria salina]